MTQLITSLVPQSSKSAVKSRVAPWLTRLVYPLGCYLVIPLFFGKITVIGRENVPRQGSVIVAPLHRSRWDALMIPFAVGRLASGRDLHFMVTSSELTGLQGWFISRLGGFPVNINRPGLSCLRHAIDLLCDGEMLVMFPEGGIIRDYPTHRLKPGVARLALEANQRQPHQDIQILPISIQYSDSYPSWGCDVTLNIGKPLSVAEYRHGKNVKDNTGNLTTALTTQLKELNGEL
jgi:1-acyl-sn-glycerol-3-phosphate acyltransferase